MPRLPIVFVSVLGLSYVGPPAAAVFASGGFSVVGVDVDASKVEAMNSGRCYLRECALMHLKLNNA